MPSSLLDDPIHEFTQPDLTPTRQVALVASSLIQCLSEKDSDQRLSPRLLLAPVVPVVPVWKPTILVVDDSSMNRKVNASLYYSISLSFYHILSSSLTHIQNDIMQMLVRSLVSRGFACCEAEDGLEALSEMLRSSNQATSKFPAAILSIVGSIVSSDDAVMAGGGAASPRLSDTPGRSPRAAGSRVKLNGVVNTNMLVASQIQHFSIDAVLIDFHMPKMNGPEAIVELRNMGKTLSTHRINTISTSYQPTLSSHPISTSYQHTLSTHPIDTPCQHTLSTLSINTFNPHRFPRFHYRSEWR